MSTVNAAMTRLERQLGRQIIGGGRRSGSGDGRHGCAGGRGRRVTVGLRDTGMVAGRRGRVQDGAQGLHLDFVVVGTPGFAHWIAFRDVLM